MIFIKKKPYCSLYSNSPLPSSLLVQQACHFDNIISHYMCSLSKLQAQFLRMAPILTWPSRFFMGKMVLSLSQETLQPTLTNWRLSLCQNLTILHQKLHQLVCQGLDQEDLLVFIHSLERVRIRDLIRQERKSIPLRYFC